MASRNKVLLSLRRRRSRRRKLPVFPKGPAGQLMHATSRLIKLFNSTTRAIAKRQFEKLLDMPTREELEARTK